MSKNFGFDNVYRSSKEIAVGLSLATLLSLSLFSCKKAGMYTNNPSVINVFNGLDNTTDLYSSYGDVRPTVFMGSQYIRSRNAATYVFNQQLINVTCFAIPDTLSKDAPIFTNSFSVNPNTAYNLFLVGSKENVTYLFSEVKYKRYTTGDSVSYFTVVNLSNDQPISVNLKDKVAGSLVAHLPYKGISEIIELPVDTANLQNIIEIRDAATGSYLTSYIMNNENRVGSLTGQYLYKNWSLILVGNRADMGDNKLATQKIVHD